MNGSLLQLTSQVCGLAINPGEETRPEHLERALIARLERDPPPIYGRIRVMSEVTLQMLGQGIRQELKRTRDEKWADRGYTFCASAEDPGCVLAGQKKGFSVNVSEEIRKGGGKKGIKTVKCVGKGERGDWKTLYMFEQLGGKAVKPF